jgi:hypothetical protein
MPEVVPEAASEAAQIAVEEQGSEIDQLGLF